MYKARRPLQSSSQGHSTLGSHLRDTGRSPSVRLSIWTQQRHEAGSTAPTHLLGPPRFAPPPRRRQTARRARLAGWQRPPPGAAAGPSAPRSGRRRRQRSLRAAGRRHGALSAPEIPKPCAPAAPGRGRDGEDGGAAVEKERRSPAVHRPHIPPAEEYDPDGEDGEPEGAGSHQPQSPRRGREVIKALYVSLFFKC